jgi:hypothetical protein
MTRDQTTMTRVSSIGSIGPFWHLSCMTCTIDILSRGRMGKSVAGDVGIGADSGRNRESTSRRGGVLVSDIGDLHHFVFLSAYQKAEHRCVMECQRRKVRVGL